MQTLPALQLTPLPDVQPESEPEQNLIGGSVWE